MTHDFPHQIGIGDGPAVPCRVVGIDPADGGAMVTGWRDVGGTVHLDRVESGVMQFPAYIDYTLPSEPAQLAYTDAAGSGTEILDAVAEFYRQHERGPALPGQISIHPDEAQTLEDLVQRGEHPPPWMAGHIAGLMGVPIVSDPEVPLGVARIRTDGQDRDVPLRAPAPGRFTAPASGWYEVTFTPSPEAPGVESPFDAFSQARIEFNNERIEELGRAFAEMGRTVTERLAPGVAAMAEAVRPVAESMRQAAAVAARALDPELEAARHWPAPAESTTCAHVCGGDPDHRCDAKATTRLAFTLPSGGTRQLPLCGPCHQVEVREQASAADWHGDPDATHEPSALPVPGGFRPACSCGFRAPLTSETEEHALQRARVHAAVSAPAPQGHYELTAQDGVIRAWCQLHPDTHLIEVETPVDEHEAAICEAVREHERLVHDDPALAEQIREGVAEAERGESVDLGTFAQYLGEGGEDD